MLWVLALLLAYLCGLIGIILVSIRPPRLPIWISPASLGVPQEEIEFASEDGIGLRGWWVGEGEPRLVIVMAHGYLMNRAELTPEAAFLWRSGIASLLLEQRAHGRSCSARSTMGFAERKDVRAAVAYARQRHPNAKIGLMGSSMGAAACAFALAEDPSLADVLILDSAYGRLSSAILGWWRFLGGRWLVVALAPTVVLSRFLVGVDPFRVDVATAMARVTAPTLFFHGEIDTLALPAEAKRNFEAAAGPKEIVWFPRCGHSEGRWLRSAEYQAALVRFLSTHGFLNDPLT